MQYGKTLWRRVRSPFEVLFAATALPLIRGLSRPPLLRLANFLGEAGFRLATELRKVAQANMDVVFGNTLSPEEKNAILQAAYRNFALVTLDVLWFSRYTRERVRQWVKIDLVWNEVFSEQNGAICLTGHYGNWELLGHVTALAGYPLTSVATPLKNAYVDRLLRNAREATGQRIIERQGAARRMLQTLRSRGRVALLLDQNTQLTEGGIFVNFFGVPATVSSAAASLAIHTGCPIIFGFCTPQPDGSYRVFSPARLHPEPAHRDHLPKQIHQLTQKITEIYEQLIRNHPEYWVWMYKRWKHVRPGDSREKYPFYTSELAPELIPPSYRYDDLA